jgi:hypothetical protein
MANEGGCAVEFRLEKGGRLRLGQKEFVGQGGEAAVYALGNRAFKVYNDPGRMIPAGKLQALAALSEPYIVKPEEVLYDGQGRSAGYAMQRVQGAEPLCRTFTRAFRERHRLSNDRILGLVRLLRQGVQHVHDHHVLIVDLNEMNFLLDARMNGLWFIDVDSYQTPGYPATALMDSVRDRRSSGFSAGTDWFSFAIISFQMLIGVHPYRGKHPSIGDLDGRMHANLSVLNPAVSLPAVCYPLDTIPPALREWYVAVFERGARVAPPLDFAQCLNLPKVAAQAPTHPMRGVVTLTEIFRGPCEVLRVLGGHATHAGPELCIVTTEGITRGEATICAGPDRHVARTRNGGSLVAAWIEGGCIRFRDLGRQVELPTTFAADAVESSAGRVYFKKEADLLEAELLELPGGVQVGARRVANLMALATQLHEGIAIQSILGAYYGTLVPEFAAGPSGWPQVRLRELDGSRILEARFERRVLVVAVERQGRYERMVFRFGPDCGEYDFSTTSLLGPGNANFARLDTGVCVLTNEQGELELFPGSKGALGRRVVQDPSVAGCRVLSDGQRLLITRGGKVWAATLGN